MQITVNGQAHDVDATLTVADLMTLLGFPDRGVALALNGTVVPRTRWHDTPLPAAADVEVLTAVQGG